MSTDAIVSVGVVTTRKYLGQLLPAHEQHPMGNTVDNPCVAYPPATIHTGNRLTIHTHAHGMIGFNLGYCSLASTDELLLARWIKDDPSAIYIYIKKTF